MKSVLKLKDIKAKSFIDTESLQSSHCTKQSTNGTAASNNVNRIKSGRYLGSSNKSANGRTNSSQHKSIQPFDSKQEKLRQFNQKVKKEKAGNKEYLRNVDEIHVTLLQKELLENFNRETMAPVTVPIEKHEVSKEYRTKMTDWMVEVCTSFKCSARTYFLST